MTDRRKRSAAALAELRTLLQQPAGRKRGGSRTRTLTLEEALLAVLRKRAAAGDAQAFEVLKDFERRYPPLAAGLERHSPPDLWSFFVCRGGMLTVPNGVEIEAVSAMIERGITDEEKAWLVEQARGSFEKGLIRPKPNRPQEPDPDDNA